MWCIQCRAKDKPDGTISHNKGCPETLNRTKMKPLTWKEAADEAVNTLLEIEERRRAVDEPETLCGIEHPYWEDPCVRPVGHPMPHIDGNDHEWLGMP